MLIMGNNIIMLVIKSLYGFTMDGLKTEKLSEGIINLSRINIMSIIIIMSLAMHIFSLKSCFILMLNMKN